MEDILTLALAKGRLAEETFTLLEKMGIDCSEPRHPGRQLVLWDRANGLRFILVKPGDVPVYVEHGVADLGVVGKDTLLEAGRPLYEVLDLQFGRCRLCVAGYEDRRGALVTRSTFRVATKYPNIARDYYAAKGQNIEIIELHGSVELGPVIGLSDVILDIVESGATLAANGLSVLEEVCDVSARLVVNRVSLKTKRERIRALTGGLSAQVDAAKEEAGRNEA
jgi:ATP phosphoribosyltransferase